MIIQLKGAEMLMRASIIVRRQALLKLNMISQEIVTCRHIHLVTQEKKIPRNNSLLDLHRNYRITGISLVRYASTNETIESETLASETITNETPAIETIINETPPQNNPYDEIPDPPTPIQEIIENIVKVHPNGEPTFESLGLGRWTPPGIVQNFLEFMHINLDVPWWLAIVITTMCARTLLFPLWIKAQKNMIRLSNHMPMIQDFYMRSTVARNRGDYIESAQITTNMMNYIKTNNISFFQNIMMPLVQAPIFISFFFGLKQMANLPVESLKDGGFLWLKDLTVYDPYYIMPILTSVTMFITIELGTDGTNIHAMGAMRHVIRVLPFVALPFMMHFPGAILIYWLATNTVSLIQTGFLKIPYVKKAVNMPTFIIHSKKGSTKSFKDFTNEIKQSYTNVMITKQLSDRERADAAQFNKAGMGPIVKTFKFNPTKQKQSTTVFTKSRE
ncbi:PREDICTED: mitochondrial inner membrane protein OXA1L [Trachymyrmex septentrionalis]|uniref:mitochondrial inner membrane protein OXA1L n=1 Tax=Trachymyrmex septentrionalis TaxID=34720 RepID=UPI00084F551D|nr:PREDICTED: mitochondrial inner membrane protein OXA1L [Trachymyrmex septentrionalis]